MYNPLVAQTPGEIDFSFEPEAGANGAIGSLALLPDGKVLIGGQFTSYLNQPINRIARVNDDGTLDTAFDPGTGANNPVDIITLQPDGKILIGGRFDSYNGETRNRIARLNPDGSLDTSFYSAGPMGSSTRRVRAIAVQPDGKILVGGTFSGFDGVEKGHIARLHPDGSLDTGFNSSGPGLGVSNSVHSIAVLPDGKILIAGYFNSYNNIGRNHIARLNPNGSLDVLFESKFPVNASPSGFVVQPDGKILAGGGFQTYDGENRRRIVRLLPDGDLDTSFDPGDGFYGTAGYVSELALQTDGKIIAAGRFNEFDGVERKNIARLNADGSLDPDFDPGTGPNDVISTLALQPNGRILIGGRFTSYDDILRRRIARVYGTEVLGVEDHTASDSDWFVFKESGHLTVESKGFEMDEITVYDLTGRELYKTTNLYATQHKLPAFNSNQILIVRVVSNTGKQMHKKVVN